MLTNAEGPRSMAFWTEINKGVYYETFSSISEYQNIYILIFIICTMQAVQDNVYLNNYTITSKL